MLRQKCVLMLMTMFVLASIVRACGPGRGIGGPRRSRKISALVFKQHVPNVSENTLGAAGLQEGAISRDDPKFQDLVPNYKEDIIFKDEEGTGADRVMSQVGFIYFSRYTRIDIIQIVYIYKPYGNFLLFTIMTNILVY